MLVLWGKGIDNLCEAIDKERLSKPQKMQSSVYYIREKYQIEGQPAKLYNNNNNK